MGISVTMPSFFFSAHQFLSAWELLKDTAYLDGQHTNRGPSSDDTGRPTAPIVGPPRPQSQATQVVRSLGNPVP